MDFTKRFPLEMSQRIFSFLTGEDLWSTLAVSSMWRYIANSDLLWKRHCLEYDIDTNVPSSEGSTGAELCLYARIWASWRWGIVRNWEKNIFLESELKYMGCHSYTISSYKDKLAVSDGCRVTVYMKRNSEVLTLHARDYGVAKVRDIAINNDYLVILLQTVVQVCRTTDFKTFLVLTFDSNILRIFKKNFAESLTRPYSVEFVFLNGHSLWLSPFLFLKTAVILDLPTATFKNINFDWKCTLLRANENVIARSDSKLAVYSLNGNKSFEMTCLEYSWINTSQSVLALITDSNVETYDRITGKRLGFISKSFFEFNVDYKRDLIYGLSGMKEKASLSLEAISLVSGNSLWTVQLTTGYSAEIKLILGKFLCYDISYTKYWNLLDAKTGKHLYRNTLPEKGRIVYCSDLFWVCETASALIMRFY